jgi:hypothetical protein
MPKAPDTVVLEVESRAVDGDEVIDLVLESVRKEVAGPAQIALPFLADVAYEIDGSRGLHFGALKSANHREHHGETTAIVADTGPGEQRSGALHLDVRPLGKDGVEMSFDQHRWPASGSAPLGDHVANAICAHVRHT